MLRNAIIVTHKIISGSGDNSLSLKKLEVNGKESGVQTISLLILCYCRKLYLLPLLGYRISNTSYLLSDIKQNYYIS